MTGKNFKIHTEIVNGVCPACTETTMLVGVTRDYYRCITCGTDLQQHINGKITYLPVMVAGNVKDPFNDVQKET